MNQKVKITINGFEIKGLGRFSQRMREKYGEKVEVFFVRIHGAPPIIGMSDHHHLDEHKEEIIEMLGKEVEFGVLYDEC